jgi:hypothetical protein
MAVCDCCGSDKPDVKSRVGLRGEDYRGHLTATPFHGPLCNDCLARANRFGSSEQRWLLRQIVRKGVGAQAVQKPQATARHGVFLPFLPARSKPVDTPRH